MAAPPLTTLSNETAKAPRTGPSAAEEIARYTLRSHRQAPRRRFGIMHGIAALIWLMIIGGFYTVSGRILEKNRAIIAAYTDVQNWNTPAALASDDGESDNRTAAPVLMRMSTPEQSAPPAPESAPDFQTVRVAELVLQPAANGSYLVNGEINGQTVVFLVDTGSTSVSVPERLAQRLNLKKGSFRSATTANGLADTYATQIDRLEIGAIRLRAVAATLNPNAPDDVVLLGMSALRELRMVQQQGNLVLQKILTADSSDDDIDEPVDGGDEEPEELELKHPLKDCMGTGNVIDAKTLRCMQAG